MKNNRKVYTIGHSNHSIEIFLSLLQKYSIDCLIDVRSVPASSYNPQFNKNNIKNYLMKNNIKYMHFGDEFGARHNDPDFLDAKGIVDFKSFRKSFLFESGIERLEDGLEKGFSISLMCSEGDPLECHRFSMISIYLEKIDISVNHIMRDGSIKLNEILEKELLKKYVKKLPVPDLFNPLIDEKLQLEEAYRLHNKDIGWKSDNNNEDLL